jgi:hypothetical protein
MSIFLEMEFVMMLCRDVTIAKFVDMMEETVVRIRVYIPLGILWQTLMELAVMRGGHVEIQKVTTACPSWHVCTRSSVRRRVIKRHGHNLMMI